MASAEHTSKHFEGVQKYLEAHKYPSLQGVINGQKMLSPMDTCVVRGSVGGVMGGALGVVFGMLMHMSGPMGGLGAMPPIPGQPQFNVPPPPPPAATTPAAAAAAHAAGAATSTVAPRPTMGAVAAGASSSAAASSAAAIAPAAGAPVAPVAAFAPHGAGAIPLGGIGPSPRPLPLLATPAMVGAADPIYGQSHVPEVSSWNQAKAMARDTGRMAKGNFKTWGLMSGTYAFSECAIEKWRGTSDDMNPLLAGCTTGAVLAARTGPKGMAIGCAGFATFSYAMEKVMHSMG